MREIKFKCWHNGLMSPFLEPGKDDKEQFIGVMLQYIGLKDITGKEIYEGDIVEWEFNGRSGLSDVVFREGVFGIRSKPHHNGLPITVKCLNPIVIGNIYESPELLNERN